MPENIMAETWDVFISYARADQDWVRTLATNLHNLGLDIFFDEWEIGPGDVLVHRLDAGLLRSRTGVLVVSPAALARPWVQNEYAAMMMRAVEGCHTAITCQPCVDRFPARRWSGLHGARAATGPCSAW
jgi:hypothetical protein